MKAKHSISKSFSIKALAAAIAACSVLPPIALSAPTGGVVVDGSGSITQTTGNTQVNQVSDRLSLEWDTFNVGRNERVQFVQPGADAIALNRILDSNGSQILGRIDANGQVILMNPNGILFGRDAVVNVGGLVASGLSINSDDFMNGDFVFSAVDGTTGTVVNRGIINAALGGNIALLGKSVTNQGLISAELGHVALAAGSEAVVTFDDQGLLGVRIDQATLAEELGTASAVNNSGTIEAKGGKILLNASVSADLFSEAVNHGGMGSSDVVFHDDGSFTIGSGNNVINTGTLNVSTNAADNASGDAGIVIVAGENIEQRGTITANANGPAKAGSVYVNAYNRLRMTPTSRIEADAEDSGKISIEADELQSSAGAAISTTGNTYIRGYLSARLPGITTENLKLAFLGPVSQASAANVGGVTYLTTAAGGNFRLVHPENDFNLLTIAAEYDNSISLKDRNDIVLGEINMQDSSLRVESVEQGGTISQAPDSRLSVSAGDLRLTADNIVLGENRATTTLYGVSLFMEFGSSIATNGSIELLSYNGSYFNTGRIRGIDREYGDIYLELRGDRVIDLNAELDFSQLILHGMTGSNATLSGYIETSQTAPIILSGGLTWNSYMATLTDPGNDVAFIQGSGGPEFGWLQYVDANDVLLRQLKTGPEVSLDIRSVGLGATLRQASNTVIDADFVTLAGDNIVLGADGRSSIRAGYALNLSFGGNFTLNGPWAMGNWYAPTFSITGDDTNNRVVFGRYAANNSFAGDDLMGSIDIQLKGGDDTIIFDNPFLVGNAEYFGVNQIDMGNGNDQVHFNHAVHIPLILGDGRDMLRIWESSTHHEVLDFNNSEDRLVIATP